MGRRSKYVPLKSFSVVIAIYWRTLTLTSIFRNRDKLLSLANLINILEQKPHGLSMCSVPSLFVVLKACFLCVSYQMLNDPPSCVDPSASWTPWSSGSSCPQQYDHRISSNPVVCVTAMLHVCQGAQNKLRTITLPV